MQSQIGCELVSFGPTVLPQLHTMYEQISGENVAQIMQACPKVKGAELVADLQALAAISGTCSLDPLKNIAVFGMLVAGDMWNVYDVNAQTDLNTLKIKTNNQRVSVLYMQGTANQWLNALQGSGCDALRLWQTQATLQFFKHNLNEFMGLSKPTANDVKGYLR